MEKLTIKAYAKRHKISIFNVMKMVRAGSVKSETVLEEDKETVYILEDQVQEKKVQSQISKYTQPPINLEDEIEVLKKEVAALKKELEALKKEVIRIR